MSYIIISKIGELVVLSDEVWLDHINIHHSEVTIEDLTLTIEDPDEIQVSQSRDDVDLYYRLKSSSRVNRVRYWMVAVKKISTGNFISSAMTKTSVVGSKQVYRR